MPPVTPSHIYALSRVLPFTQTSPKPQDEDILNESRSIIETKPFLNGLALLLVRNTFDDYAAVSIVRDPPRTMIYYTKSQTLGADYNAAAALEKIKQALLNTKIDHFAEFLSLSVELCFERILFKTAVLGEVAGVLGITPDTPNGDFTIICVPDEEVVWKYILDKYKDKSESGGGRRQLEKSTLKRVIRSFFLEVPKRGVGKEVIEGYLKMAGLLTEILSNGLELWSTGALASSSMLLGGNEEKNCGVFLAKKEFGTIGVELEKIYEEAEVLMGRIVDVVRDVGAYAKAAADIAWFVDADVDFRRSVLERRVTFQEVKPMEPTSVEIIGKPVDLINKFLRKSGRAAITDAGILRAFSEWPESRLKDVGGTITCNVHCELNLILHVIKREYYKRNGYNVYLSYGCSEASCYLCEVYIEALRTHLVGEELQKLLTGTLESEVEKRQDGTDDFSAAIVSQLKGFTSQPGKTLRGWFSGMTQQETGRASSAESQNRRASEQQRKQEVKSVSVPQPQSINLQEERFENPGYSRGYRKICTEWQFPKGTPAVVRREVEKSVEAKLRYIYTVTRASGRKSGDFNKASTITDSNKLEDLPPTILQARPGANTGRADEASPDVALRQ
ncbi:hypothetical protein TWF730_000188 [Orbilia blumenaviensis]|uniref:Uncharacterized protein n=1 Tax=Orbilia blumenaviensis TaxID=1796055 RepID=A0AAV9VLW9_9PEZI